MFTVGVSKYDLGNIYAGVNLDSRIRRNDNVWHGSPVHGNTCLKQDAWATVGKIPSLALGGWGREFEI